MTSHQDKTPKQRLAEALRDCAAVLIPQIGFAALALKEQHYDGEVLVELPDHLPDVLIARRSFREVLEHVDATSTSVLMARTSAGGLYLCLIDELVRGNAHKEHVLRLGERMLEQTETWANQ
jgi:hypothetical protein